MKSIDILIPTIKTKQEIRECEAYKKNFITKDDTDSNMIGFQYSCIMQSASKNRNACLNLSHSEYVIMIDDDITGFYEGWIEDMLRPLIQFDKVMLSAARLLDKDCAYGPMNGCRKDYTTPWVSALRNDVPFAAIAHRKTKLRYDENYIGSGFEDTDFIRQMEKEMPGKIVVINNTCKLVHLHEQKNQGGNNFIFNRDYYTQKWNDQHYANAHF